MAFWQNASLLGLVLNSINSLVTLTCHFGSKIGMQKDETE